MRSLGTNEIDVLVFNRAPLVLYHRVIRDGRRILSRDPRATTTREGYALSRYCDYVPQLAKIRAARRTAGMNTRWTRGEPDVEVVRRHLSALRQALANLRRHAGVTVQDLRADSDLRWTVEREMQQHKSFQIRRI